MNSTASPSFDFGMLTCPAYVDGRKRENGYFRKDRINNNNALISYRSTPRDMYTFNATLYIYK